jgi:hypothetical protein
MISRSSVGCFDLVAREFSDFVWVIGQQVKPV